MINYKDLKKGDWFYCPYLPSCEIPLLKVSASTYFDPKYNHFVKFKGSVFEDDSGAPIDCLLPVEVEIKRVRK